MAVQIAERQGGRDKVLEHLGSAHTDAELSALLEVARRKIYPGQGELELAAGTSTWRPTTSKRKSDASKRSVPPAGTTNKNAATTSGYYATRGETSSASCSPSFPTFWLAAAHCRPNHPDTDQGS
jgi:hypothetical protein